MESRSLILGVGLSLVAAGCGDDGSPVAPTGGSTGGTGGSTSAVDDTAGSSGAPGTTGMATDSGDETGTETGGATELEGTCEGVTLRPRPADTAQPGPWAVGARTVDIDGLTVEVWYPAEDPGAGDEPLVYDIRSALPRSEQAKIPDEQNPWQECDCYRDLPLDEANGPYPVVLFVHGTAGFRTQSLPHMVHWASRGFVVMAADHPGLWLQDLLSFACGQGGGPMQDLQGDLGRMIAAVRGEIGGLEDFGDRLDAERIATAGHSAGGSAVSSTGDDARVIIPMAAGGVSDGDALESSLILGAMSDSVVAFSSQVDGYEAASPRKRLVGIANTGHLVFSEICSLRNEADENLIEIGKANGVCGLGLAGGLFQCDDGFVPDAEAWDIIHFASSAVLEETLHCEPEAAAGLALIQGTYPVVLEFREEL